MQLPDNSRLSRKAAAAAAADLWGSAPLLSTLIPDPHLSAHSQQQERHNRAPPSHSGKSSKSVNMLIQFKARHKSNNRKFQSWEGVFAFSLKDEDIDLILCLQRF